MKFGHNTSVSDFTDVPESARLYDTPGDNVLGCRFGCQFKVLFISHQ